MQRIYVVEDDDNIREMVVYALTAAGFLVTGFARGDEALDAIKTSAPSLVLLDIMLPGADGLSVLAHLRRIDRYKDVSVIMLTAKDTELDRVKGLDLGADDYITKPFSIMEMTSRVKAVLRRTGPKADAGDVMEEGSVSLYKSKRIVKVNGAEVPLTYKEFELLQYMMINKDIVLSRDMLLAHVWGYDYGGESRTVDMHIKTLRQKLGDGGDIIKTVRNVGYKVAFQ